MIKATDLRIGNRVHQGVVTGMFNSHGKQAIQIMLSDKFTYIFLEEDLNPEPIEESDLRELGFANSGDSRWVDFQTHYLELTPSAEGYWYPVYAQYAELSSEDEQRVSLNRIQYLHELENLVWVLKGIKLERK